MCMRWLWDTEAGGLNVASCIDRCTDQSPNYNESERTREAILDLWTSHQLYVSRK